MEYSLIDLPRSEADPSGPSLKKSGVISEGSEPAWWNLFTSTWEVREKPGGGQGGARRWRSGRSQVEVREVGTSYSVQMATPLRERNTSLPIRELLG